MKLYIKTILFLLLTSSLYGLQIDTSYDQNITNKQYENNTKVYGQTLFNGSFKDIKQFHYNPEYILNVGDELSIKVWGAIELEISTKIDMQGNIFLPKVGIIKVLGLKNKSITAHLQKEVSKVYKDDVYIYADLKLYQHIAVYVTGSVNKPGLYEGLSSDSILQFIDKARGIDTKLGSFRHIEILRQNSVISYIDLYDFLSEGKIQRVQFKQGDTINVKLYKHKVFVSGNLHDDMQVELKKNTTKVNELLKYIKIKEDTTHFKITNYDNGKKRDAIFNIDQKDIDISSGDTVEFISNKTIGNITVNITGEHNDNQTMVVSKDSTIEDIVNKLNFSKHSKKDDIQLFRKSIAVQQKELLEAKLKDLEHKVMTTGASTKDEAAIRAQEAPMILEFIQRAKKIEPKGQVVINKDTNLSSVTLEDGDILYVPKSSSTVLLQGEVNFPGAQTWVDDMDLEDFISNAGGLTQNANEEFILVIKQNGMVYNYRTNSYLFGNFRSPIKPGDSILVLGKVDSKSLMVTKDITQILYQIAVGASVIMNGF